MVPSKFTYEDGCTDFTWACCEIFAYYYKEYGAYKSVYYGVDQDAEGRGFPSHSTRIWII